MGGKGSIGSRGYILSVKFFGYFDSSFGCLKDNSSLPTHFHLRLFPLGNPCFFLFSLDVLF